jgi:hypothetical protein
MLGTKHVVKCKPDWQQPKLHKEHVGLPAADSGLQKFELESRPDWRQPLAAMSQ